MIWGAVGYKGTFDLVIIDSTLKGIDYVELLSNNLIDQAKKKSGYDFIFQHDNALDLRNAQAEGVFYSTFEI